MSHFELRMLGWCLTACVSALPVLAQPRGASQVAGAVAVENGEALPPNPYGGGVIDAGGVLPPNPYESTHRTGATGAGAGRSSAGDAGVTVASLGSTNSGARESVAATGGGDVPPNPYAGINSTSRRYGAIAEQEIIEALRSAEIRSTREVGNTSINLRCDLAGEIDGAYKPSERRHAEHWRAEIAAFRVSQVLGLERVPPAVFRRVPRENVPEALRRRVYIDHGESRGAMIYWVPVIRHVGIFSGQALEQWTNLLVVGIDLPARERLRAEEISTLIAFDYIIGNWDRWHGTNTLADGQGHLVYRDNNGGFLEPLPRARHEIILSFLQRVQRFSRVFVERARAFGLADLQRAIRQDADGDEPLLSRAQLLSVLRRRDTLIQYVDALIAIHGESAVLVFP